MRTLGILSIGFASIYTAMLILRAEKEKCEIAEGIYLLLLHIRHGICEGMLPLSEIYKSFESDALSRTDFLSTLKEKGLAEAIRQTPLPLPDARLRSLLLYAKDVGARFAAEELAVSQKECEAFRLWLDEYRKDLPRRLKIKRTLSLSVSCMLLLFLL